MEPKIDTRERILIAATRRFKMFGYGATGLNDILKESRAPKGSFYYHFPNGKEELALEAIQRMSKHIQKDIEINLGKQEDASIAIKNFIRQLATKVLHEDELYCAISILALETCFRNEILRAACVEAYISWQKTFEKKLLKSGFTKKAAHDLSVIIQSTIEGANILAITTRDNMPLLKLAEEIPAIIKTK
jgi:TetR/AcrR family transcriptional regulator, lmrAB and yxaGH operons repressor